MSHHQNVGENRGIRIANKSYKNVLKVQIFGNYSNKSKLHSWRN